MTPPTTGRTVRASRRGALDSELRDLPKPDQTETISTEDAVVNILRDAILGGTLSPGRKLRQESLAAQLGVSRIPLRDALRRLEGEGLVAIDGRRGARVTTLGIDDVREIYELRILLEGTCAKYAVEGLDDAAAARLLGLSERMDRTVAHDAEGRRNRRAFYAELYRFSGRPRMEALILQLRDEVGRYHVLKNAGASFEAHSQLRAFIRSRDGDGAARLIRRHLQMACDDLVDALEREVRERELLDHSRSSEMPGRNSDESDEIAQS